MADMTFTLTDEQRALKAAVYDLCKQYPAEYWRELDAKREYPEAFVDELTKAGLPRGPDPARSTAAAGLGIMEGALILEEINRSGGNAGRLPRADVHHGHRAAARHRGAEARATCPRSPPASCGCRPSASPSPTPARTPPSCRPRRSRRATATW